MITIKINGMEEIQVKGEFMREVDNAWGDKMMHNRYLITVDYEDGYFTFEWTNSHAQWQKVHADPYRKKTLTDGELYSAFGGYLCDGNCYDCASDIADFLCEFGYTNDSESIRRGMEAYHGCENASHVLHKVFRDKLDTVFEYVSELGYC